LLLKYQYLKNRTQENRSAYWNSRKELDIALKKVNSSLQELRYLEVREFIEKEIIQKFLINRGIFDFYEYIYFLLKRF